MSSITCIRVQRSGREGYEAVDVHGANLSYDTTATNGAGMVTEVFDTNVKVATFAHTLEVTTIPGHNDLKFTMSRGEAEVILDALRRVTDTPLNTYRREVLADLFERMLKGPEQKEKGAGGITNVPWHAWPATPQESTKPENWRFDISTSTDTPQD